MPHLLWGRECARVPQDTTRIPPPDTTGYHLDWRSLTLKYACVICRPGKPWMDTQLLSHTLGSQMGEDTPGRHRRPPLDTTGDHQAGGA